MFNRSLAIIALFAVQIIAAPVPKEPVTLGNPYKCAKVGDYSVYKLKVGDYEDKVKLTVVEVGEKEITLRLTMASEGEWPNAKSKIDLAQPFDPIPIFLTGPWPKYEKLTDGTETLKLGDKTYDCTWTTYKMSGPIEKDEPIKEMAIKVWMAKDVPGMVKMAVTAKALEPITIELTEFGNKK